MAWAQAWRMEEIEVGVTADFEVLLLELVGTQRVKENYNLRVREMTGRGKGLVEGRLTD